MGILTQVGIGLILSGLPDALTGVGERLISVAIGKGASPVVSVEHTLDAVELSVERRLQGYDILPLAVFLFAQQLDALSHLAQFFFLPHRPAELQLTFPCESRHIMLHQLHLQRVALSCPQQLVIVKETDEMMDSKPPLVERIGVKPLTHPLDELLNLSSLRAFTRDGTRRVEPQLRKEEQRPHHRHDGNEQENDF